MCSKIHRVLAGFVLSACLLTHTARAEDNTLTVINGTTSNASGIFVVGATGTNNTLIVTNAGVLQATVGYIGSNSAAIANLAIVTGSGSIWTNSSEIYIGNYGAGNRLIVTNEGRVYSTYGYIGYESADNNSVTVTGTNSLWNMSQYLYMGRGGRNSQLIISDGGRVNETDAYVGAISNNSVLVTGAGSVWNNSGTIRIGYTAASNALNIANGGTVYSAVAQIGSDGAAGASNNAVTVTGTNSAWFNTGIFTIGQLAGGNSLKIDAGVVSNSSYLIVGNTGAGSSLIITNGGRLYSTEGYAGYGTATDNTFVRITGSNSLWNMSGVLFYAGRGGRNTQVTISDGARMNNADGYLGGTSNNSILVTDTGSIWNNSGVVRIGYTAASNALTIANGGRVNSAGGYIGSDGDAGASNNAVSVTGGSSAWINTGTLNIGNLGGGNSLLIDGGVVSNASSLTIGQTASARPGGNSINITNGGKLLNTDATVASGTNAITVTGPGSLWSNNGTLLVGYWSGGNSVTIANSGQVFSTVGRVGNTASNSVLITSGGVWTNSGYFSVGYSVGTGNQLTISDGGKLYATDGYIGEGGNRTTALVTGSNSLLNLSVRLLMNGTDNQITIADGARLNTAQGNIGDSSGSNNVVIVTGPNSVWDSSAGPIYLGNEAWGSKLIVSNGAKVFNTIGYIGGQDSFSGGTPVNSNAVVIVTGAGSVWSNSSNLRVGNVGRGANFTVSDGATVYNAEARIGGFASSSNNIVLVSGGVWSNTAGLYLGYASQGNSLTIANGGKVYNTFTVFGGSSPANNNSALVTGNGSLWSMSSVMEMGDVGSSSLIITNGGTVSGTTMYVARLQSGSANVVITGPGSLLQSSGGFYVGSNTTISGSGSVTITDGGTLEANTLVGGFNGTGTISNRQGIYQFTSTSLSITPSTAGSIMLTNGTISHRDVTGADINSTEVDKIVRQGNNTFRLNHSTNSLVPAYTFDSVANTGNPMIYQTLMLTNGSRWRSTTLRIGSGGVLKGAGTVEATVVTNAGTITAGFSPGILEFTGDLKLEATSVILTELAGTSGSQYDQVNVANDLQFNGTLTVSLIDGFSPADGNSFDIFDFTTTSGAFSTVNLPTLGGGLSWNTSQLYTLGTISVTSAPEPAAAVFVGLGGLLLLRRRR